MPPPSPPDRWYYARDKQKVGPVSLAELRRLLAAGTLEPTAMVWQEGTRTWCPLADVIDRADRGVALDRRGAWIVLTGAALVMLVLLCAGTAAVVGWRMWRAATDEAERQAFGVEAAQADDPERARESQPAAQDKPPQPEQLPAEEAATHQPTLVPQLGHGHGLVQAVALTADNQWLVTGGIDGTVRLWEMATGREVRSFRGRSKDIKSVALSADGRWLVSGGFFGAPSLWEVATGREVRAFGAGADSDWCVALSRDAKWLVTAGLGNTAQLWDVETGKQVRSFRGHTEVVSGMALSDDGQWLATASWDKTARLWEMATGKEVAVFRGHTDKVECVALSRDGKWLVTGSWDMTARLWKVGSAKEIQVLGGHDVMVRAVALAGDGQLVVTCDGSETARLWETATGREVRAVHEHGAVFDSLALSADDKWLVTGSANGTARLWDVATGKELRAWRGHANDVHAVAASADGRWLITTGLFQPARLWDVAGGRVVRTFGVPGMHDAAVDLSDDGQWLVTGNERYAASLWEVATGKEIGVFQGHNHEVSAVALSRDKKRLLTGSLDMTARVWDVATGKTIQVLRGHRNAVNSVAWAGDGKWVVTCAHDRTARLWDVATGKEMRTFAGQAVCVMSPDDQCVVVASGDGARLCKLATGEVIRIVRGPVEPVHAAAVSSDGRWLVTSSLDSVAPRLWDMTTGREIRAFRGRAPVWAVALSGNKKSLFTAGDDCTCSLWDVASGQERCAFVSGEGGGIAITPDNYYLAAKGALPAVAWRFDNHLYSFDQFDAKFNRPDKVLNRIGMARPELVAAYRHAYEKRLKRLGFTEQMLSTDLHVPTITIRSDTAVTTRAKMLQLKVKAGDAKYQLDRILIDVNGVPVRAGGIDLRKQPAKTWQQDIAIELSAGANKIDASVVNEKGAESLKETLTIQYDAPPAKPNLYVVAVGVSDYRDARFRLTYADKDARDLADLFENRRGRFGAVKVQRILNRAATRENILKARDFLKASQVDDLVVLFFAGHGLLDANLDYYFATADIDFKQPAKRGLAYEAIEDLLAGIRARKKLLLMDTCHSGELDKEDVQVVRAEQKPDDTIKVRAFRGLDIDIAPRVGLGNSVQLVQELFADLRHGTGAVVIASAGGAEYALESATWKNGVFTHALLRGLKGEADRNHDGRVQVSELRDFVEQEVRRLTHGRQTPTARRENLVVDFAVD